MPRTAIIALLSLILLPAAAQAEHFEQTIDIPYHEAKGETLYLDTFVPNDKPPLDAYAPGTGGKGLGIIDVVSGGWSGARGRLNEHKQAQLFQIFTARGYTVFAIRPGSLPDFTALEMVENIERGIRWVKANAEEYGVDPDRLGIVGASAGGHLASLVTLDPKPAQPDAADPLLHHSTNVAVAAVFFPPTDFLNWNGRIADIGSRPGLMFSDGLDGKSDEEIRARLAAISPARQVQPGAPPFMIVHGDADPVVPLQQSEVFVEALRAAGNEVTLDIPFNIIEVAGWFDVVLRAAE